MNASLLAWELWQRLVPRLRDLVVGAKEGDTIEIPKEGGDEPIGKDWYVGQADLDFFQEHMEGPNSFAGDWEQILNKEIPNIIKYQAWRRSLKDDMIIENKILEQGSFTNREMGALLSATPGL
eukprot:gene7952-1168_t